MNRETLRRAAALAGALAITTLAAGCTTLIGKPTSPLLAKREEPGVALCLSERTSSGGVRIIGRLEKGIYPIQRVSIEYRTAGPSDAVPAATGEDGRLDLLDARSEKVAYRKGADDVTFDVSADAARSLGEKVIWYRWIVDYDRNGSLRSDRTDIYRTSVDEAGHPRSAVSPGPDTSVVAPPR